MNMQLLKAFIGEEVSVAFSQMAPLKAPNPDGFAACFFQENWAAIGEEVCNAINNFFLQLGRGIEILILLTLR